MSARFLPWTFILIANYLSFCVGLRADEDPCRNPELHTHDGRFIVCRSDHRIEFRPTSKANLKAGLDVRIQFSFVDLRGTKLQFLKLIENRSRSSLIVAFKNATEGWELFFGADAPVIFEGFVHDYRSHEAIAESGPVKRRRFNLPMPMTDLRVYRGPLLEIDGASRRFYFNLDVRREVATPRAP